MTLREPFILIIIPIFIVLFAVILSVVYKQQRKLANKLNLYTETRLSSLMYKILSASVIVSLLVLGLAQPQVSTTRNVSIRSDTQISFLMDVSVSMAGSSKPNPCVASKDDCEVPHDALLRIDRAKLIIKNTINSLGVVSVAVYGFSNKTVWQMPFTYSPQLELLDNGLTAGSLQAACRNVERCTNWWTALFAAANEFDINMKNKIIVLLTDGDSDVEMSKDAVDILRNLNIKIFSVSIGDNNERIWLYDDNGNPQGHYPKPLPVKDDDMRFVAENSGGRTFAEDDIDGLVPAILVAIGNEDLSVVVTSWGDLNLAPIFFFVAMLCSLVFIIRYVADIRLTRLDLKNIFKKTASK